MKTIWAATAVAAAIGSWGSPAVAAGHHPYLRTTFGYEWSLHAIFLDRDCTSGAPAALFGCGLGVDGQTRAARGTFGQSPSFEIGFGWAAAQAVRLEVTLGIRTHLAFEGQANFSNTPGEQPVHGDVRQVALMGWVYLDVAAAAGMSGPLQPFVGLGLGLAGNSIGPMLYEFPGLPNQPSWSLTPGGIHHDFAFAVAAGFAVTLSDRATLEVAYRYTDYGQVVTDVGPLVIRRGVKEFVVEIDQTIARLRTDAITLSLRWAFAD